MLAAHLSSSHHHNNNNGSSANGHGNGNASAVHGNGNGNAATGNAGNVHPLSGSNPVVMGSRQPPAMVENGHENR